MRKKKGNEIMCRCGEIVGLFDAVAKNTGKHIRKLFCVGEDESSPNIKGSKVFEVWADGKCLDADPTALIGAQITYVNVGSTYAIIDIEGLPE